jgi:hypothetical protein
MDCTHAHAEHTALEQIITRAGTVSAASDETTPPSSAPRRTLHNRALRREESLLYTVVFPVPSFVGTTWTASYLYYVCP